MPWSCRSERHSPWAVMPAAGNVAQACFQRRVFPFPETLPPEKVISSALALSSRGAIRSTSKSLALIAASLTEGDKDAAVVEPPDELAPPAFEWSGIPSGNWISPGPADLRSTPIQLTMIDLIPQVYFSEGDWIHTYLVSKFVHQ